MLAEELSQFFGTTVQSLDIDLYFSRGYWTHITQDVKAITGYIRVSGVGTGSIGCWESASQCVKKGITVFRDFHGDLMFAPKD
jgi:predicted methyltransferase